MGLIYFISFFTVIAAFVLVWAIMQLWNNQKHPLEVN